MVVLGNSLNPYFNLSKYVVYDSSANYRKINLSLTFSFYNYCLDPVDLIDKLIISKIKSISIFSIHDIIPTIIKANKYYEILKQLKLIKCSSKRNIINQIIELNYAIYNKYISFNTHHINKGNKMLRLYRKEALIGIHARLRDECIVLCNVSTNDIYILINMTKKMCKSNCRVVLSSMSNEFNKQFQSYYNNVFIFNPFQKIKHSSKSKIFDSKDIEKTIMDIYFTSSANYLILSGGSTFSLLILYIGYYSDYQKCKSKEYHFINNYQLFDHLEAFRIKNNCKNISL